MKQTRSLSEFSCLSDYTRLATRYSTVKPVENGHYQKDQKLVFKTNFCLMQVKSIAECFRPSLSYRLSLSSLFCLFLSGCIIQVLLHVTFNHIVRLFVFNIPSAVKLLWGQGHSLKSHPTDWRSRGSNLQSLVYKA